MVLLLDHPKLSRVLTGKRGLVVVKPVVLAVRAAARGLLNLANLRHERLVRRSLLLRHEVQRQGEIVNVDEALAAVLDLCEDYIRGGVVEPLVQHVTVAEHLDEPAALHLHRAVRAAAELVEHRERRS